MQKRLVIPLALLFLPTATAVLFLLHGCILVCLRGGGLVFSPSQPAWMQFCLTHQKLFARLWVAGMGGSLLNAALTVFYFHKRELMQADPWIVRLTAPLFVAVGISLPLSAAALWAGGHTSLFNPPVLSHRGSISHFSGEYLLPKALLLLSCGVTMVLWASATLLIFLSALQCLEELWSQRKTKTQQKRPGA